MAAPPPAADVALATAIGLALAPIMDPLLAPIPAMQAQISTMQAQLSTLPAMQAQMTAMQAQIDNLVAQLAAINHAGIAAASSAEPARKSRRK